jgi:hypothetical protein
MRLAQLNPTLHWSPGAKEHTHQLEFDCPRCGPPFRIMVNCSTEKMRAEGGVWKITIAEPTDGDYWGCVSLTPSIHNHNHGRKKPCGFHCVITDGELT